jgi:large subunit ribosomal protein L15
MPMPPVEQGNEIMKLNQLSDNQGARKSRIRVGRGIGSGKGKTGGRGGKGQTARSGVAINGFEGGQMPLFRRLPKKGFNNIFRQDFVVVNVGTLQQAIEEKRLDAGQTVTAQALKEAGIISRVLDGIRLLNKGTLKSKLTIEVAGASKAAIEAVEKAGGSVVVKAPKVPAEKAAKA